MTENREDGTLYVTGFTAPKSAAYEELPSEVTDIFTTAIPAVVPVDANGPVEAVEIANYDSNQPLLLPFSILWMGETHGGADLSRKRRLTATLVRRTCLSWPGIGWKTTAHNL